MITVLCAKKDSVYKMIPGIDVWDETRDAYFFTGSNPVITHAPFAQWSRMKAFAHNKPDEKELAFHCLKIVVRNGGIFEHPAGSSFFKAAGVTKNIYSVDQSWWGFAARKRTWLYFSQCKPIQFPILQPYPTLVVSSSKSKKGRELPRGDRSKTVEPFAHFLINSINETLTRSVKGRNEVPMPPNKEFKEVRSNWPGLEDMPGERI